jgi:hypothetical protein
MNRKNDGGTNSVLFDGIVSGDPVVGVKGKRKECSVIISSWRYHYHGNGDCTRRVTGPRVQVVIRDPRLIGLALKYARNSCRTRVVGRLACSAGTDGVYIVAEHIEYHPVPVKGGATDAEKKHL